MMTSSEVRDCFINYFKRQQHEHVASSSLIPENDPTLLFANAGMNQFKNLFLGLEKRPYSRAVTSQKCVRAGGKHNDLDNVGFTARHHTFFEMLGNFSFGDYFKKDAIRFAWDFLTNELKIPKDKLYVTVFETDDEAAEIWHRQEGVPKERIFRFGEKDNFWRMGDVGPCGPCSEIFFDHGPQYGKIADPYKSIAAGEDRYIEIWNLVFMQFYEDGPGKRSALPKPSVDTGSGFERLVAAVQGRHNNYKTDIFKAILEKGVSFLSISDGLEGLHRTEEQSLTDAAFAALPSTKEALATLSALRVLGDHCRAVSFLLADGALPSNEGRGYVLRRIMRRAIRYGRKLSTAHSFLPEMSAVLIDEMGSAYPELTARKTHILSTIKDEETRFLQTLDNGTVILSEEIRKTKKGGGNTLSGETVFKLYDTYGFPVDLTALMAAEEGLQVDEAAFEKNMQAAKEKAKASWKGKTLQSDEKHLIELVQKHNSKPTVFTGYENLGGSSPVVALSDGSAEVPSLSSAQTGVIILQQTPFYAEGGGQVGDLGTIRTETAEARVHNCTRQGDIFLHHVEVTSGEIRNQDTVTTQVEVSERRQTTSNHSATHLMHKALRVVLGDHVTQAGSLVDSSKTRFDFTHNKPVSAEEIRRIEDLVNDEIAKASPVTAEVMPHQDALSKGAMALFGEKYGDQVRVLTMGNFSCELCGGTHVKNTAEIRAFKIVSESGVSSGVRRIEAITGSAAVKFLMECSTVLDSVLGQLNMPKSYGYIKELNTDGDILLTAEAHIIDLKSTITGLEKQIKKIQAGQINIDDLLKSARPFRAGSDEARLVFADLGIDDRDVLSQISDQLKNRIQRGIVIAIGKGEASHPVIISVSKDLNPQFKAGELLKDFAQALGGKGGGRPDFAQGAVPDRSRLQEAYEMISKKILQ